MDPTVTCLAIALWLRAFVSPLVADNNAGAIDSNVAGLPMWAWIVIAVAVLIVIVVIVVVVVVLKKKGAGPNAYHRYSYY